MGTLQPCWEQKRSKVEDPDNWIEVDDTLPEEETIGSEKIDQITVTFEKGDKKAYYTLPFVLNNLHTDLIDHAMRASNEGRIHFPQEKGWRRVSWQHNE